eukprot:3821622-Pyramimonas_sp.AAC.2
MWIVCASMLASSSRTFSVPSASSPTVERADRHVTNHCNYNYVPCGRKTWADDAIHWVAAGAQCNINMRSPDWLKRCLNTAT